MVYKWAYAVRISFIRTIYGKRVDPESHLAPDLHNGTLLQRSHGVPHKFPAVNPGSEPSDVLRDPLAILLKHLKVPAGNISFLYPDIGGMRPPHENKFARSQFDGIADPSAASECYAEFSSHVSSFPLTFRVLPGIA